jgi:hypothetical protein
MGTPWNAHLGPATSHFVAIPDSWGPASTLHCWQLNFEKEGGTSFVYPPRTSKAEEHTLPKQLRWA